MFLEDSLYSTRCHQYDGLLTVDQERCHPPYEMGRQAHVTEFRTEQFAVDVIQGFVGVQRALARKCLACR